MEHEWGYDALHVGNFPVDWVKPGGLEDMDYRKTTNTMLSSEDVLNTNELKKMKCMREDELISRRINVTNHTETHKCSNYCKRVEYISVDYNEDDHKELSDKVYKDESGKEKVSIELPYCRMHFGYFLKYDNSGENNITRGKERVVKPYVEFDDNGQPRYVGIRNHPRILQEPHSFHYYGANNDLQKLLVGGTEDPDILCDKDRLTNKLSLLSAAGIIGLDRYCGSSLAVDYTVNYFTLGGMNSEAWNECCKSLATAFCDQEQKRSLRSVVAKSMYEVTKQMSVTQDQTIYQLCGGKLVRTTDEKPSKCSLSDVDFTDIKKKKIDDDIVDESFGDDEEDKSKSFTWNNLRSKYIDRGKKYIALNLNKFIVQTWKPRSATIPQFMGYDSKPTWPLEEDYAKSQLVLFKPWFKDEEELKLNGKYVDALLEYMSNPEFPRSTYVQIIRLSINAKRSGEPKIFNEFETGDLVMTPTKEEDRTDPHLQQAIDVAQNDEGNVEESELENNIPVEKLNDLLFSHPHYV